MRILLVDDEQELSEPLAELLRQQQYQVDTANEGKSGLKKALSGLYDLLILDWMLPHHSGLEICQQVRAQDKTIPILFLTAKDTLDDRVIGLDAGADDYLIKPFESRELLARVRALSRRLAEPENPSSRLVSHNLELDLANQAAYLEGSLIKLSDKEFRLLHYLMENADQILSHQQIYDHLWGEEESPSSNVLPALIRLLRRKINQGDNPPIIDTVYGKGYRFSRIT
ncbi:MAG: response regulator transcription factor [Synechococcaceae cyanobacterium RL_1_2]|nr:response regulator transcription factor [Synechococcaceae cyanobacterium RL_1_2]